MIRSKKKVTDFDVNDLTSQTARDVATAGGDSFSESTEPPASAPQSAGDMMYILPVFEDGDKRLANPGDETLGAGDSDWTQPDDLPATDELLDIVPPGGPGDPMEDEVIFFDDGWMGEDFVFYPFDPLPVDENGDPIFFHCGVVEGGDVISEQIVTGDEFGAQHTGGAEIAVCDRGAFNGDFVA